MPQMVCRRPAENEVVSGGCEREGRLENFGAVGWGTCFQQDRRGGARLDTLQVEIPVPRKSGAWRVSTAGGAAGPPEILTKARVKFEVSSSMGWKVLLRRNWAEYVDELGAIRFGIEWSSQLGVDVRFNPDQFVDVPGRDGLAIATRIRRAFAYAGWTQRGLDEVATWHRPRQREWRVWTEPGSQ